MASIKMTSVTAPDVFDTEAMTSESDSVAMAAISRRFDAMIASDQLGFQAIASDIGSGAMVSMSRRPHATIVSDDSDI
jgi:hypothetical protein